MSQYLYRGLRSAEVDAGYRLIPKGIATFENMRLALANTSGGVELRSYGPLVVTANHLYGLPTSGVSTSTNFNIAARYSTSGPEPTWIVVRINRDSLAAHGIEEHWVREIFPNVDPQLIDFEEVILTSKTGSFPKGIIDQVYDLRRGEDRFT